MILRHNGEGVVSAFGDVNGYSMASNSVILNLSAGDKVHVEFNDGNIEETKGHPELSWNTFSGFRIL